MRDGITEIGTIIVALIVLLLVPLTLEISRSRINTEAERDKMINQVLVEVNGDGTLTLAEMEHLLRVMATEENPRHISLFAMEGINMGGQYYIYRVEEKQLYELLLSRGEIRLPEGGIIGVHR